jgi:hypothetical protein
MAVNEDDARSIARRIMATNEFLAQEARARGDRFESLDEERLVRKLTAETTNSPFFNSQSWGSGPPGGTITYTANIFNPDPVSYSGFSLFGYLFFAPANFIQSNDTALLAVDNRFPRYMQRLGVASNASASASFTVSIPTGITPGIYLGNCFLVQRDPFDVGDYFDRAGFDLTVT